MNIQERYLQVIGEVEKGHRALVRFTPDELEHLHAKIKKPSDDLKEVLCLIDHSATLHLAFEPELIRLLNSELAAPMLVFTLDCSRKHIIQARGQRGQRLGFEFLEALKKLLYSSSPEVVEWTLRTIEECGGQGVYFLRDLDKIKPPPWKWFNQHQRAVREIIELLERRWRPLEKSKSGPE